MRTAIRKNGSDGNRTQKKENCGNSAPIVSESDTSAKNTQAMFNFYAFFSIAKILTLYKADMVQGLGHTLYQL